jgi:hypothetical protein
MHEEVYGWITQQGLSIPWPMGKPYHFPMERVSGNHFKVKRASNAKE